MQFSIECMQFNNLKKILPFFFFYNQNYKKKKETRHEYYLQNRDYIRVYQYLYYRHKKYENERDLDKVNLIQNNFKISLEE